MKIYDKKGFWESIISFVVFCGLSALASYFRGGELNYAPSSVMIYTTFKNVTEALSEEKSRLNMEFEKRKLEIMIKHYGTLGRYSSVLSTVAMVLCLIVMEFNLIVGLVMVIITIFVYNRVFKTGNDELNELQKEIEQKKQSL